MALGFALGGDRLRLPARELLVPLDDDVAVERVHLHQVGLPPAAYTRTCRSQVQRGGSPHPPRRAPHRYCAVVLPNHRAFDEVTRRVRRPAAHKSASREPTAQAHGWTS